MESAAESDAGEESSAVVAAAAAAVEATEAAAGNSGDGQPEDIAGDAELKGGGEGELEVADEDEEDNFDEDMIQLRHSISFTEVGDGAAGGEGRNGDEDDSGDGDDATEVDEEAEALAREAALAVALGESDRHAHDMGDGEGAPGAEGVAGAGAGAPAAAPAATAAEASSSPTPAPTTRTIRALSHEQRLDAARRARLESVSSAIDKIREVPVEISELGQSNSALLRKQLAHGRLADYFLVVGARTDGNEELAPLQHMYETGMDMRASISDGTAWVSMLWRVKCLATGV